MTSTVTRINDRRQRGLRLDNVVSSHSELGPAPPDGGYGWIILVGVILLRATLPSLLLVSYGIYIMMANESGTPLQALPAGDTPFSNGISLWIPVILSAMWSLTDPFSRTLAAVASIRLTSICGVILAALGLVATKFVIKLDDPLCSILSCLIAGFMSGVGISLATTPADHLLARYFRLRLAFVQSLVRVGQALGSCIMPVITCILLLQYGHANTLLIHAAISFQALIGAIFFRKPIYRQPQQHGMNYTLLQNEDDGNTATNDELETEPTFQIETAVNNQDEEIHDHHQPFYNSIPRPLFSDAELNASGQDVAFFIEDLQDEDVILYAYGDHLRRSVKLIQELKMLYHPTFYAALLLVTVTRITNITFWILLPSLIRSRFSHLNMENAAGLLSAVGVTDVVVACAGHWLVSVETVAKKRLISIACFLASGGLYALSYDKKLLWLICASVTLRFGASIADILCKPMLRETMGPVEFRLAHSLLDVLSGLLVLLYTLAFGQDYGFSFWILSCVQLVAGTIWGLQPLISIFCVNKRRHQNAF